MWWLVFGNWDITYDDWDVQLNKLSYLYYFIKLVDR